MRNNANRLKLFFGLLLLVGVVYLLNTHHPLGSQLPALGPLLYPPTGVWQQAEDESLPFEGLTSDYLKAPVEIIFDDRHVPHVFAQNDEDAFFAQGYLQAYFRLWQMDMGWRAAGGFLSEVLGERTLEYDRRQRKKGMLEAAHKVVAKWKDTPKEEALIEAYVNGINARIAELSPADYPAEYKLLGFAPESWTSLKVALFYKKMVETLSYRHFDVAATSKCR